MIKKQFPAPINNSLQGEIFLFLFIVLVFCYRLDIDQAARRNAQIHFNIQDPDFYQFEGY